MTLQAKCIQRIISKFSNTQLRNVLHDIPMHILRDFMFRNDHTIEACINDGHIFECGRCNLYHNENYSNYCVMCGNSYCDRCVKEIGDEFYKSCPGYPPRLWANRHCYQCSYTCKLCLKNKKT